MEKGFGKEITRVRESDAYHLTVYGVEGGVPLMQNHEVLINGGKMNSANNLSGQFATAAACPLFISSADWRD